MATLLLNGFPKSGIHALQKACVLLGVAGNLGHDSYASGLPDGYTRSIFLKRDPRNILISWLRFNHIPVTTENLVSAMESLHSELHPDQEGKSLAVAMAEFEGWRTDPNTLVVSYEELAESPLGMDKVAAFLGVRYPDGAFGKLEGLDEENKKFYNESHSDYQDVWDAEVQAFWDVHCTGLLTTWGYAPWQPL